MPSSKSIFTLSEPVLSADNQSTHRRRRVSPEHTLSRVRENQRRHRARRREHVASLELKLADTQQLLSDARAEIVELRARAADTASTKCHCGRLWTQEDANLRDETASTGSNVQAASSNNLIELPSAQHIGEPQLQYSSERIRVDYIPDGAISFPFVPSHAEHIAPYTGPDVDCRPPPCCSDFPSPASFDMHAGPECLSCRTRPPPGPTESTTLCSQAYVLISQQNFHNLEQTKIRLLLDRGLRRAQREGEGCRVENGALLRLLDYISSG